MLRKDDGSADIKLRLTNTDYFNSILDELSKITESAGNKCREVLSSAIGNAYEENYINYNPIENAKQYPKKSLK